MLRWLGALLIAVLGLASSATAEEAIRNFVSDVTVNADGSLDVRETIAVQVEGNQIRHGIIRDFPTTYTDRYGQRVEVGFSVTGISRDGNGETWSTSYVSNGVSIKIGNKDVFLDDGQHTYKITYHTTRQIGFFDKFDELYWNVTGNGWTFPIEHAQVLIRLPAGAQTGQYALYTGGSASPIPAAMSSWRKPPGVLSRRKASPPLCPGRKASLPPPPRRRSAGGGSWTISATSCWV